MVFKLINMKFLILFRVSRLRNRYLRSLRIDDELSDLIQAEIFAFDVDVLTELFGHISSLTLFNYYVVYSERINLKVHNI